MIESISITNFKCFESLRLPLANLNVLAGVNGVGKSTVIQALLLLRQLYTSGEYYHGQVSLLGDLIDLGRGTDILYDEAKHDVITIALTGPELGEMSFQFQVDVETGSVSLMTVERVVEFFQQLDYAQLPLFSGGSFSPFAVGAFNYLNAERFGPRKTLPVRSGRGNVFDLGSHGEYVFDALSQHQDGIIISTDDPRYITTAAGERLRDQVEAWLSEISPGVQLRITSISNADIAIGTYNFGREGALRSPDYRPTNVGFGLSYILPVLAALLGAAKGGLVLIENPEAHLHPRGQTRMGELCARAAAAGVQVVIETHSDHVLDGARIAVKEGIMSREAVGFHYFFREQGRSDRTSPEIDASGRLSEWPEGFFDQHRRNAARLARSRTV
ncbi:MAG: hypothetical protein QOC72_624 [Methylobacteriaceae bacterium]|jgi:predicted ATPase|nr:hypothetical protein [Methylobacteriaceae bacterium]